MNLSILETQFCRKLSDRPVKIETVESLLDRVTTTLAEVERLYDKKTGDVTHFKKQFEAIITDNLFWPSGRILNNAGAKQGQLASCFVLPLKDDFKAIFETLCVAAQCHRTGGGTGFDFSELRERNAPISTSEAAGASGPVSWMRLLAAETTAVMSGGKMRGANMGVLSVYHPDILEFITSKNALSDLGNFNISVRIDNAFMEQLERNAEIHLVSPLDRRVVATLPARHIWECLALQAWKVGDPGVLFSDHINAVNPLLDYLGPLKAANPCGEQMLYDFEASNLGSLNLSSFYDGTTNDVAWNKLEATIEVAVRMLDNVIDACKYPDPRIYRMAKENRRLGLGVMGYADLLIKLGLRYDSLEAIEFCHKVGRFIQKAAWEASTFLAKEKGAFPNYQYSSLRQETRNCGITCVAPTGTISMVAECSSGIEPRFAPLYRKNVINSEGIHFVDEDLIRELQEAMGVTRSTAIKLIEEGNNDDELPQQVVCRYRYAHQISGAWHIATVAAWQPYIDNGLSKTVNIPEESTVEDVANVFLTAWKLRCKGVTVYRAGSLQKDLLDVSHADASDIGPVSQSVELRKAKLGLVPSDNTLSLS